MRSLASHPSVVAVAVAVLVSACAVGEPEPSVEPVSPTPGETPAETGTTAAPTNRTGTPTEDVEASPAEPQGPVDVGVTTVAEGLVAPWEVAFAPDGRVFVTERDSGKLLELDGAGGTTVVQEFPIDPRSEGGLLGLAVSPGYDEDGLLYAYYTTSSDNRIVRFVPGSGSEPEVVLEGIPRAAIHNGGRIAFGPDGLLYAGTGDAASPDLAQDPNSLAGKILRIDPGGGVPAGNPDPATPVYALGLRNVQGLAWTGDGTLYAAVLGPDRDDAVYRVEAGQNFGWPRVTGVAGDEAFTDPVFVAQPAEASWSGAAVLVGGAIPQWEGDLFVAALRGQRLWRLVLDPAGDIAQVEELLTGEYGRLRRVAQAPDGSLWLLTSNRDGRGAPAPGDDRILRLGA
jgi:glucose/arabinose dehydrogenase